MPERKEPITSSTGDPLPASDEPGVEVTPTSQEPTTETMPEPQEIVLQVVPVAPLMPARDAHATLDAAFMLLCEAMMPLLEDLDDMPAVYRVQDIMGWYANGNREVAWAHAVLALERVIQTPLRGNA